jgi:hypothetical protein
MAMAMAMVAKSKPVRGKRPADAGINMVQPSKKTALSVACILGLAASGASRAALNINAGATPRIIYTDNLCLTADDKESDIYGEVTPFVSMDGTAGGRRANFSLSTSVDVNSLTNSDLDNKGCGGGNRDRDQYTPDINGRADAILVEQWLFIDADVTASQNEVSPFVAGGGDQADRTGNTNTTYRYSVSPYVSRRFKNTANLLLRYTYDDQYNTKEIVGDSSQERWLFTLGSGPVFSPLTWSLQGDYSKTEYTDTPGRPTDNNSELKSAQMNFGYQINRTWQINGFYGNEWNDFVSSRDDIDGSFWGAGLHWTPNARTSVDVGTGDRFFGNTPWLRISHRHKRSVFSADYEKTLTYSRDIRTQNSGGDFGQAGNSTNLSNSPILDERFTLAYSFAGRRSSLSINASYSDQTQEEGGDLNAPTLALSESTFKNVSLSISRPLSRKVSLSGGVGWQEQEPNGESSELINKSETWTATLRAQRPLGQNANLSLDYQYTDRQSDSTFNQYQENRITLSVTINLL